MSTFFTVALSLALVFFVPFWAVKYLGSKTGPTDDSRYVGIKGWLALCIALMGIVGPLYVAAILFSGFDELERSYPAVLRSPEYSSYKSSAIVISLVVVLVQMYSAWRLLISRDRSAVFFLKKFLVTSPLLAFCYPLLGSFYFSGLEPSQWNEAFRSFLAVSVANAIWYFYLTKSKRVSATYGEIGSAVSSKSILQRDTSTSFVGIDAPKPVDKIRNGEITGLPLSDLDSQSMKNILPPFEKSYRRFNGVSNLERVYGVGRVDQANWAACLESSECDEIRACAKYWRG